MTSEQKTKKQGAKKESSSKKTKATRAASAGTVKKATKKSTKKRAFKDVVRAKLLEEKDKILNDVSTKIRQESREQKRDSGDIYDIASDERERELSLMLGDRERKKLTEIDLALERIEDGTYGECEDCGEPVTEKRLEILPFTRVCVDCQSKHEREQRISGSREDGGHSTRLIDKSDRDV